MLLGGDALIARPGVAAGLVMRAGGCGQGERGENRDGCGADTTSLLVMAFRPTLTSEGGMVRTVKLDGYVRVSRVGGRGGESFISPEVQRAQIEGWAALRGVEIAAWHTDLDVSGGSMDRPGLNDAMRRIRDGQTGGLAVARLDRLSRAHLSEALRTVRELHELGAHLAIVDLGVDPTTPFGEFAMTLMLAMARLQRRQIGDAWSEARERAVQRGVHVASATPTGYVRGDNGRLEPHPQFASVVGSLFGLRAAGASWQQLADVLQDAGVTTPYGAKLWTTRSVQKLVCNPVYLGEARSGEFVNPAAHQALTSREVWEAAQQPRGAVSERRPQSTLNGLLRCAGCRHAMKPDTVKMRDGRRERTYRCRGRYSTGLCEDRAAVMAHLVEGHVERLLLRRVGDLEAQAHESTRDIDVLRDELRRAEHALEVFRDDPRILDALNDPAMFVAGLEKRRDAVQALRDRVSDAEARLAPAGLPVAGLAAMWPGLSVQERRQVFAAAIDAVMLRSGRTLAIQDRVVVLWRGDAPGDLPGRGRVRPVEPFVWPQSPGDMGVAGAEDREERVGGG